MRNFRLFLIASSFIFIAAHGRGAATSETKRLTFALLEDYDKGDDLKEPAMDFATMKAAGIDTWRGSFGWDDYEEKPGHYDFQWLHQFADLADRNGIKLRPYIAYTPAWAGKHGADMDDWNDPPRNMEAWVGFMTALSSAMRLHRNVLSFEIYNEENSPMWWDGTPAEYSAVLTASSQVIRKVAPHLQILFGGMVWPDTNWIRNTCLDRHGDNRFDILPFHAYPETWTPPDVRVENFLGPAFEDDFLPTADALCGRKPIWINETGFATTPGRSELDQANWWARAIATFVATKRIEHIGVYEIKDLAENEPVIGDAPNRHLGLLRRDRTPKLAFYTVRAIRHLLNSDKITVADSDVNVINASGSTNLYYHMFIRPDGVRILFIWDRSNSSSVCVRLRQSPSAIREWELDGTSKPVSSLETLTLQPGLVRMFELR